MRRFVLRGSTAHRPRRRAPPRPHPATPVDWRERAVLVLSCLLLGVAFLTGGSSQQSGWGVTIAELLAIILLLCVVLPRQGRPRLWAARWALAVAGLIVAIPLLQLLPIPGWLWQWPSTRQALQHDLATAGVTHVAHRWSLAPAATERDLYLLLPAAALFAAMQVLPRKAWRQMLWWLLTLISFSLVLAIAQLGVPQDSILNPFPQYAPALTGVFANRNHQACALAMGLVLALVLLLDARVRIRHGQARHAQVFACAILVAVFAAVLPLVNSRAGVLIAIVGAAMTLLACGAWSPRHLREQRAARWRFGFAIVVLAIGVYGAFAWMQRDLDVAGSRWQMTTTTAQLAGASMPLGGGAGSFVRMFEQFTQGSLMRQGYINAAHDDYVQWWYAGGVLALIAMLGAAAVLVKSALRLLKLPVHSGLRTTGMAALLALLMPLLHSTVDYPLRTVTLMTGFGVLAGIAVAGGVCARERAVTQSMPAAPSPAPHRVSLVPESPAPESHPHG